MWRLAIVSLLLVAEARAQATATLRGEVVDMQNSPVATAIVRVSNALTGFEVQEAAADDGTFSIMNIPFQTYAISVRKEGFGTWSESVSLRSNVPLTISVKLAVAEHVTSISVLASDPAQLIDTESTGTRTELNSTALSRLPIAPGTRGLESMLLTFPGFAANANGAIHPRGAHNQMTYVIDGMPVSDQLTGAFANAVDPSIVQTIELFTGNVPAEYGNKVSGVAVITTRSGMGTNRKFSGNTQTIAGQFDTLGQITQFAGGADRWGYFASFNVLKSNRFLDQVSLDNFHNGGNSERSFGRLDYQLSPVDQVRWSYMLGRSSFELANLRSQHAAGQDQRQMLRDASTSIAWLRTLTPRSTFDVTASYRTSIAQLFGSPGDTPVTAEQARHLSTATFAARWTAETGRHSWRTGADYQFFPVSENFSFAVTDPQFNDPGSQSFIPTLETHDLSREGRPFVFSDKRAGRLYTGFAQDTIRLGRLILSLGARYDRYRFIAGGNQFQPRVGIAYYLRETRTVFRASYNRTYQTPPNENLLLSSSEESSVLVPAHIRQTLGSAYIAIRPERQNVFEGGIQQALGRYASLNAAVYHKNSRDMQDNDNFFNTGIIFPTALQQSRTNGAEFRLNVLPVRRLSGSLSLTHYHTVVTPPFTGGLFLGSTALDLLNAGPFVIDHDQRLASHAIVQYAIRRNLWISGAVRHDSGLVSNPSDPVEVAADPDYADLLPYVKLNSDPPRVKPRTVTDIAVGYDGYRDERRVWDVVLQFANITGTTALYNFQSIFVGTRLIQPRSVSMKVRWYF
jgi:hypothetical protein